MLLFLLHQLGVLVVLLLLLHLLLANVSFLVWLQQRETCPQLAVASAGNNSAGGTPVVAVASGTTLLVALRLL